VSEDWLTGKEEVVKISATLIPQSLFVESLHAETGFNVFTGCCPLKKKYIYI
jgi:hypothetical protein